MNRNTDQTKTLLEAWDALRRYRWRFILATFGVMTGVVVGSFLLPRKYKAEAIFERRTDMVLTEIVNHGASNSFLDSQRVSLVQEIAGQMAIEQMVESLKTSEKYASLIRSKDPFELQNLRAELAKRVTVHFDIGTKEFDRIRVGFIHDDRQLANAVVNTLVENYIQRTRRLIDGRLQQTARFFQSEVDQDRRLIENLENDKLTFEIEHAELLPEFPGSVQLRLTEAQQELAHLNKQRTAAASSVDALRKMIESTPAMVPQVITSRNPQLEQLEKQRHQLKTQFEEYTDVYRMTQRHPDMIALKEQIASIEQEIDMTAEEIVTQKRLAANRKRDDLEVQLSHAVTAMETAENQAESVKELIARLSLHSTQLFPIRSDYRKISRRIEQAQRQQTFWEENLRRVRMALTAETGNRGVTLDFVKPCTTLDKPVSPDLVQVLMAAVVLGLATGCINVLLAYRTDDSFRNGEHLAEAFNVPMIGAVSEIISRRTRIERRVRNLVLYPLNASAMAAALTIVVGLLYINLEKPHLYEQLKNNPASVIRQSIGSQPLPATTDGQE